MVQKDWADNFDKATVQEGVYLMTFENELEILINKYSKENDSNTPDFILANFLDRCLEAFNLCVSRRTEWYDEGKKEGSCDSTM